MNTTSMLSAHRGVVPTTTSLPFYSEGDGSSEQVSILLRVSQPKSEELDPLLLAASKSQVASDLRLSIRTSVRRQAFGAIQYDSHV